MKKLNLFFIIALFAFLFNGCIGSSSNLQPDKTDNIVKVIDNSYFEFGSKDNMIETITYTDNRDVNNPKEIVFYVDRFPYSLKMDLCLNTGDYLYLKNIKVDKDNIKTPIYQTLKADCNSNITIKKIKYSNYYEVSYTFNYLKAIVSTTKLDYKQEIPVMDKEFKYSDTIIFNSKFINMDSQVHWRKIK